MFTGESCGWSSVHWHVAAEGLFGLVPAEWNFNPCLSIPGEGGGAEGIWCELLLVSLRLVELWEYDNFNYFPLWRYGSSTNVDGHFFCLSGCRDARGGDQAFWRPRVSTAGTGESSRWGERDSDSTHSQGDRRIPAEHRHTQGEFPRYAFISLLVTSSHPEKFLLVSYLRVRTYMCLKDDEMGTFSLIDKHWKI